MSSMTLQPNGRVNNADLALVVKILKTRQREEGAQDVTVPIKLLPQWGIGSEKWRTVTNYMRDLGAIDITQDSPTAKKVYRVKHTDLIVPEPEPIVPPSNSKPKRNKTKLNRAAKAAEAQGVRNIVLDVLKANGPMAGSEVIKHVAEQGHKLKDKQITSALRLLYEAGRIQRKGKRTPWTWDARRGKAKPKKKAQGKSTPPKAAASPDPFAVKDVRVHLAPAVHKRLVTLAHEHGMTADTMANLIITNQVL